MTLTAAAPAAAMFFEAIDDQLILSGEVQAGDFERLKSRLDESQGRITTLILRNSPGGLMQPTYNMMHIIRERKLRTAISGYCISACAHIFIAGAERHFTDDQPATETYVGFHGIYSSQTGVIDIGQAWSQRQVMLAYSAGRIDPQLIERWTSIYNRRGRMAFYDSERLKPEDGVSIFLCKGNENLRRTREECEKIHGTGSYESGVFTSKELISVKRAPGAAVNR